MSKKEKSIDYGGVRPLKIDYSDMGKSLYLSINVTIWIIYYNSNIAYSYLGLFNLKGLYL